jgi:hypothetical protein
MTPRSSDGYICDRCKKGCRSDRGLLQHQNKCKVERWSKKGHVDGSVQALGEPRDANFGGDNYAMHEWSSGCEQEDGQGLERVIRDGSAGVSKAVGGRRRRWAGGGLLTRVVGRAYTFEEMLAENNGELPEYLRVCLKELDALEGFERGSFGPFPNRIALKIVLFVFYHAKLTQPNIDRFLNILNLIPKFRSPFPSRSALFEAIDAIPLSNLEPLEHTFTPTYEKDDFADTGPDGEAPLPASWFQPVSFRYFDIIEATQHLLFRTDLADSIEYAPRKVFNWRGDRVVSDFMTGNYVHRIQVCHFNAERGRSTRGLTCTLTPSVGSQRVPPCSRSSQVPTRPSSIACVAQRMHTPATSRLVTSETLFVWTPARTR